MGSQSWIKGTEDAILYATENNLEYEVVQGIPYDNMLQKISEHKAVNFVSLQVDAGIYNAIIRYNNMHLTIKIVIND